MRSKKSAYETHIVPICTKGGEPVLSRAAASPPQRRLFRYSVRGIEFELTPVGVEVKYGIYHVNSELKLKGKRIEKYLIMPAHVHMIVALDMGADRDLSLNKAVLSLITYTNKRYNEINQTRNGKLWQRSFYGLVIDGHKRLETLKLYRVWRAGARSGALS
ncbi:MAG: transposase [Burkholderiales bacterium]